MERPSTSKVLACAVALAHGLVGTANAQTPGFRLVGFEPGAAASRVFALSADGRVAAGASYPSSRGFTWTESGERVDFGLNPDLATHATLTYGISGDASTLVGETYASGGLSHAFRYRGPGAFQDLGLAPGPFNRSYATGVSGDGATVVGYCEGPGRAGAFRWTESGGMQDLGVVPNYSSARSRAISRNGSVVVGAVFTPIGDSGAFAWTTAAGMVMLQPLPGSSPITQAYGVSADGRFIVGESGLNGTATMWTDGVPLDLGVAPGWGRSLARGVSDDGSVVVGHLTAGVEQAAAIWTTARGMETLSDYLAANSLQVPSGWNLYECYAVSSDGQTIAGFAVNNTVPGLQGFVATVPAPPAVILSGPLLGFVASLRRRPRCVNHSGTTT